MTIDLGMQLYKRCCCQLLKNIMKLTIVLFSITIFVFTSCKKENTTPNHEKFYSLSVDSLKILQTNIPNDIYNDMAFVSASTGYAVSSNGRIIKTENGGYNWTELASNVSFYLKRIQFVNSQTGYVIGGDMADGYLLKTENGGSSWQKIKLDINEPGSPSSMYFLNATTGFITGKNYFKKTTDGGATWANVMGEVPESFADVSFKTNNEGFATALAGKYYMTINGGVSWQLVQSDISDPLGEISHTASTSYAISGTNLIDLQTGKNATGLKIPAGIRRLLFLNNKNGIGIGQHYDVGFLPYGDIHLTNSTWGQSIKKTYSPVSEALDFRAIAKKADGKILILGQAVLSTPLVELTY